MTASGERQLSCVERARGNHPACKGLHTRVRVPIRDWQSVPERGGAQRNVHRSSGCVCGGGGGGLCFPVPAGAQRGGGGSNARAGAFARMHTCVQLAMRAHYTHTIAHAQSYTHVAWWLGAEGEGGCGSQSLLVSGVVVIERQPRDHVEQQRALSGAGVSLPRYVWRDGHTRLAVVRRGSAGRTKTRRS